MRRALVALAVARLFLAETAHGADVAIVAGSLTITYDGTVFADTNSSYAGLTPGQDFMRYGRFWSASETVKGPTFTAKSPQEFRPLPITGGSGNPRLPNFRDNRAELDAQFPLTSPTESLTVNGNGPVANSEGRNLLSTDLSFDPADVLGTVTGLVQTNGVSAWWFANDDIMDMGGSWVSWGDLSLRYDASRVALGYSGWVFANQLGGIGDLFDTKNIVMVADASGISLSGELWGSDGTSSDPYNENPGTWATYSLMNSDLKIGTFAFQGVTVVPEPSSMILAGLAAAAIAAFGRRQFQGKR